MCGGLTWGLLGAGGCVWGIKGGREDVFGGLREVGRMCLGD